MDIRKPEQETVKHQQSDSAVKAKFKAGVVQTADAKVMLPPAVQTKLTALTSKYGIPFDLSNIGLDGKMADNDKAMRKVVDMVEGDSKLLREMLKLIRRLMKAEIKLAQFHRAVTTAAVKHQEKIDKYTADIFLKMAGYGAKATKLEHRTNVRNQIKEKRTQAYAAYYQDSVYGTESQIIDAEFEQLAADNKILSESKAKRIELNSGRKQKINEYVQSAYQD